MSELGLESHNLTNLPIVESDDLDSGVEGFIFRVDNESFFYQFSVGEHSFQLEAVCIGVTDQKESSIDITLQVCNQPDPYALVRLNIDQIDRLGAHISNFIYSLIEQYGTKKMSCDFWGYTDTDETLREQVSLLKKKIEEVGAQSIPLLVQELKYNEFPVDSPTEEQLDIVLKGSTIKKLHDYFFGTSLYEEESGEGRRVRSIFFRRILREVINPKLSTHGYMLKINDTETDEEDTVVDVMYT